MAGQPALAAAVLQTAPRGGCSATFLPCNTSTVDGTRVHRGVIADNDPVDQEKAMNFNALLTNAVVFHNAVDIAEIVRQLLEEGWKIVPEDLAQVSPYLTERLQRFGEYSTHELRFQPAAYDPKLVLQCDFVIRCLDASVGRRARGLRSI
ncbi:Tn3 family transposase [Streptomyces sp. NPDC056690]|uniref:Tn3 family transposase n=1 Tax=unclassified Streptomyces TaxID=2593676 RepID=UPI003692B8ED